MSSYGSPQNSWSAGGAQSTSNSSAPSAPELEEDTDATAQTSWSGVG